jgi:sugar lactone lactonase YvrE
MAPAALAVGADGTLYFIDLIKGNLVQWTASQGIKVLANVGAAEPSVIFTPAGARNPRSLAVDSAGRVYVLSRTVLERYESGAVTTVAGVNGQSGTSDGAGSQARFTAANAIVADAAGNVYIADGELIRKVTPAGLVTTVAGQVGHVGLRTGPLPGSLGIITQLAIAPDGVLHLTADNALVKVRLQ